MRKSEKRGKRAVEKERGRYSTLYREISIMRICNFNALPNPAKLPKRSQQPQPFVPIRSIAVLPSFATSTVFPVPGFRALLLRTHHHHLLPFPLSPLSQNPITPRATSYVQQPNPHTRTRRAPPPARSNRFRPCCLWIFVFRFSRDCQTSFRVLITQLGGWYRARVLLHRGGQIN